MDDKAKIDDFRKQALYYSKEGKRFKILIETATGCFGQCPGCAFTKDEKSQFQPKIPPERLPAMFSRLAELLDYRTPGAIVKPYETTVINYGGSEHFIYDDDYLGELFKNTASFFDSVNTNRNVLAFSSSGLMNPDKMHARSRQMLKWLNKDQFVVDFVIDLARFDKLADKYQKSFDFFKENFGFVDLAVNIEAGSDLRDWKRFSRFVEQNGILNVDLVYALNKNNFRRVAADSSVIFDVYETVVANTTQGKSLFDLHGLLRLNDRRDDALEEATINDACDLAAENILNDALFVNSDFDVFPALFVIFADVPLNERLEIEPVGNLFDMDFKEKFVKYRSYLSKTLFKTFLKNEQCFECELAKQCHLTGSPLLNRYLYAEGEKISSPELCKNPVRPFLLAKTNSNPILLHEDSVE